MFKKISIVLVLCMLFPVLSFAQINEGDTELDVLGGYSRTSIKDFTTITNVSIKLGLAKSISQNVQLGIQPLWTYAKVKYEKNFWGYYGPASSSNGTFGATAFLKFNIITETKWVPFLTAQLQIDDVNPEGSAGMTDVMSLNLGGGVRYFITERAALNVTGLYNFYTKDAEYKPKSFNVLLGFSVFL